MKADERQTSRHNRARMITLIKLARFLHFQAVFRRQAEFVLIPHVDRYFSMVLTLHLD